MKRINYAGRSFVVSDAGALEMMRHATEFLRILGSESTGDSDVAAAVSQATAAVTISELDGTPVEVPATPWGHVSVRAHAFGASEESDDLDEQDPLG
ncbi:hypothetical protein [Herbiconiux daphne]|uniref:Uncharacterized protein n=1 Tax=Herbiconiux daphne TaxID=2970914 RepID=A0ABT2GZ63_9MICO|nr:hypothetical protein [Herbiconiux daphne]MCS5733222.1 hypothetical protein [Herbiconiux daphne]